MLSQSHCLFHEMGGWSRLCPHLGGRYVVIASNECRALDFTEVEAAAGGLQKNLDQMT